jgi:uncharacterized protein (DUF58 family)
VRGLRTALSGLTTRGRCFLAAGAASTGCGLLLGELDLVRIGVLLLILPVVAAAVVARTRYRLACGRFLDSPRLAAGGSATVTLRLDNVGRMRTSVLLLEDEVPQRLGAGTRFVLDRIEAGGRRELSYRVRGNLRGRYQVGPLTVRLSDPFGLCELNRSFRDRDELIVSPAIESLPRLRRTGAALMPDGQSRTAAASGDDDAATRAYRHGDDLRRVHWRSTARAGELMVRREEAPRSSRATVLLDTREGSWAGEGPTSSFEWAVSAAASVASALGRSGFAPRLVLGTGEEKSGTAAAFSPLLDELAVVMPTDSPSLSAALARLRTGPAAGLTVAVLGQLSTSDAALVARARPASSTGIAVLVDTLTWAGSPAGYAARRPHQAGEADPSATRAAVRASLWRAGWLVAEARYGDTLAGVWPTGARRSGSPGRSARARVHTRSQPGSPADAGR